MKRLLHSLLVLGTMTAAAGINVGCAHEVSHTESDKPGWFGGSTHKETTVYKNPDGSTSVDHKEAKTD
ncbi:MAG: hypothetical protein JWM57_629 [Phycisphaerales bacterium]|nr:hypothetical protein [Phycisphaerales bacterium]